MLAQSENTIEGRELRIGIDGRVFRGDIAGVGRYTLELCRVLDQALPDAKFFVYSVDEVTLPGSSPKWTLRTERSSLLRRMRSFLWLKLRVGELCKDDELDVFWGCGSFLPSLPARTRSVVTVYDFNYQLVPETMHRAAVAQYRLFFLRDVRRADVVLPISHGTACRLEALTGRRADAIVGPGVASIFRRPTSDPRATLAEKYGVRAPYLLAVATWEPRKNLELLLWTFIEMKQNGLLPQHELVLIGSKGWRNGTFNSLLDKARKHGVMPVGFIPYEDLPLFYAGSDVFVFPSIYEGFGMPVAEARACGATAVATDIPELREAGGEGAIYVSPTKEGLRAGILEALSRGHTAGAFSPPTWEASGKVLAAALRGELGQRSA